MITGKVVVVPAKKVVKDKGQWKLSSLLKISKRCLQTWIEYEQLWTETIFFTIKIANFKKVPIYYFCNVQNLFISRNVILLNKTT